MRIRYKRRKKISAKSIILIFIVLLGVISIEYARWTTKLEIDGEISILKKEESSSGKELIIKQHSETTGDGSLKQDGTNYYFSGASSAVENYINFNSESWRIIGIDSNGIKIQKVESIGEMAWNNVTKMQIWADSTLNTYLNTTYFNTISDTSQIVLNPIWDVGTSDDGLTIPTRVDYQGTESSPRPVALITVQELTNAGGSSGWLAKGIYHWTITGVTKNNGTVYRYNDSGNAKNSNVTTECAIEPVLYLKDTINLTGDGSINNPYNIVD